MKLELSGVKFTLEGKNDNRMMVIGCITKIDEVSTYAPCGTDGKRVVFTKESVEKCHKSYVGMPVNCTFPDWLFGEGTEVFTGHGDINIGCIEDCWVEGNDLMAKICIWKNTFPDIGFMVYNGAEALGFSVECFTNESHENDEQDGYVYVDEFTGVGCAMLWKNSAAFQDTYIKELAASRKKDDNLNKEEMQELFKEFTAGLDTKFAEVKASIDAIDAKVEAQATELKASVETQVTEMKASIDAQAEQAKVVIEASAEQLKPPAPSAVQTVLANADVTDAKPTKAERIAKINASTDLGLLDKLKQIKKINEEQEKAAE